MFFRQMIKGFLVLNIVILLAACTEREQGISAGALPSVETSKQMDRFNQLGNEVYTKTLQGDFLEARKGIIEMNELIPQMRLVGITTTMGIKALGDTLVQAIKVFNAVQLDSEQALFQSARIRLMADALSHPNTPLWLQYNKVIQEDLHLMEQAVKQKKYADLNTAFSKLKSLYLSIKPALQVSLQEEETAKLESAFLFMQSELQAAPINTAHLSQAIKVLQEMMDKLFQRKTETTAYLPFMEANEPKLNWIIALSSIIIIILGFAAWRMRVKHNDIITVNRQI
jgi:sporulation protein YpjB